MWQWMFLYWESCKRTLALLTKLIQAQRHTEWIESFRPYEEKEYTQVIDREIHPKEGPLNMGEVVRKVSEATRNEAILVTDVGQNQMMACRYFKFTKNRSVVTSGGMGTMGFGLPAPSELHSDALTVRYASSWVTGTPDDHAGTGDDHGTEGSGKDHSAEQ